jgi:hypothetical protein
MTIAAVVYIQKDDGQPTQAGIATAIEANARTEKTRLYEAVLKELEIRHPDLSPAYPGNRSAFAIQVMRQQRTLTDHGIDPLVALRQAVTTVTNEEAARERLIRDGNEQARQRMYQGQAQQQQARLDSYAQQMAYQLQLENSRANQEAAYSAAAGNRHVEQANLAPSRSNTEQFAPPARYLRWPDGSLSRQNTGPR